MIRKSKLEMYRELIRKPAQQGEEIKLPINGGAKIETQEEKDKKKNTTIIKITEKEKQEEHKPKPIKKNKISDEKLKKFINFRL